MIEQPRIRIELEVPALQITSMLMTHNKQIEEEVEKGIQMAIDELSKEGTLATMVAEQVIKTGN